MRSSPSALLKLLEITLWVYAMLPLMNVWVPPFTGSSKIWYIFGGPTMSSSTLRVRSQWSLFSATNRTPLCLLILTDMTTCERNGSLNLLYPPICLHEENGLMRFLLNSRLTTIIILRTTCNSTLLRETIEEKQEKITMFFLF